MRIKAVKTLDDLRGQSTINENGCWIWNGSYRGQMKYAQVTFEGSQTTGIRVAFRLKHGRWPEPLGMHSCHTPMCTNPDHALEGTYRENNLAKWRIGPTRERELKRISRFAKEDRCGHLARGRAIGMPIGLEKMNGRRL